MKFKKMRATVGQALAALSMAYHSSHSALLPGQHADVRAHLRRLGGPLVARVLRGVCALLRLGPELLLALHVRGELHDLPTRASMRYTEWPAQSKHSEWAYCAGKVYVLASCTKFIGSYAHRRV